MNDFESKTFVKLLNFVENKKLSCRKYYECFYVDVDGSNLGEPCSSESDQCSNVANGGDSAGICVDGTCQCNTLTNVNGQCGTLTYIFLCHCVLFYSSISLDKVYLMHLVNFFSDLIASCTIICIMFLS